MVTGLICLGIGIIIGGIAGMLIGKRNKGFVDKVDDAYKKATDEVAEAADKAGSAAKAGATSLLDKAKDKING